MVLEKTLESSLGGKEIKPVILREINSGRTDAEAENPAPWPLDAKSSLTGKDADAGED